jgi:lysozyme
MTMNIHNLVEILKRNEGLRLTPYRCTAGKLTIGYGHTGPSVEEGLTWTREHAEHVLLNDARNAAADLDWHFKWWRRLSDTRQEALCDMCFNLGVQRLSGFRKMLIALRAGQWQEAAKECLDSRYAKQVGNRAKRNAFVFEHGRWPTEKEIV